MQEQRAEMLRNVTAREKSIIKSVYVWMTAALAITAGVSYAVASSPSLMRALMGNSFGFILLIIAEFALVFFLSARLDTMSQSSAIGAFLGYAVINGIMKEMDAFIGIRGIANVRELASLPEQAALVSSLYNKPVHMEVRVPHTRWVVLRYPTECFALQAGMATVDFEDYFYDVCINVDYPAMRRAMEEAKQYLDTVDKVHIIGKGTDLSFSVKGMSA